MNECIRLGCIIIYDGLLCWSDIDDDTTYLLYEFIRIQENKYIRKSLLDNFGLNDRNLPSNQFETQQFSGNKTSKQRSYLNIEQFNSLKSGPQKSEKISPSRVSLKFKFNVYLFLFFIFFKVVKEYEGKKRCHL